MDKPLIFTNVGNIHEDSLVYSEEWEDCIRCEVTQKIVDGLMVPVSARKVGHIAHIMRWSCKETGELRKQSVSVHHYGIQETAIEAGKI